MKLSTKILQALLTLGAEVACASERTCTPAPSPLPIPSFHPDCTQDPLCSNDVCDTTLSPGQRAAALVAAYTADEKVANLVNTAPGVPRLGVGAYQWWSEGLHGLASSPGALFASSGNFSFATSFPSPILMGAAFDDPMIQAVAEVISTETRVFDNAARVGLDLFTPNINPFKDPRWGRGQETPGEDPFRIQNYITALLSGLENDSTGLRKTIATCKHFAAYDFEGAGAVNRFNFDAIVTTQDLSEYYLPPFKTCAATQQVGAIMCSYNAVNGIPTCADSYLLQDILREHYEWEADNHYVTSDCDAVMDIWNNHHFTSTAAEAAAVALKAGTDVTCVVTQPWEGLAEAWNQSLITEQDLDKALTRLYAALISVGFFDADADPQLRSLGWGDVNTPAAQQLAHDVAVAGTVLIKNDGTLPLGLDQTKSIALIGPWANATTQMQGNYFGPAPFLISPLAGAQNLGLDVTYVLGTKIKATDASFSAAVAAAEAADAIIFMGGIDDSIEAEGMDRVTIVWPEVQLELLRNLTMLGKPVVVVQFGGGQIDGSELLANSNVNSILWAGYPGQDGGAAVFDVLVGNAAPAGRLPITQYPASYVDSVPPTDMNLRPVPGNDNLGRTHMWYTGEAIVPFGFGLHYTSFDVSVDTPPQASFSIQDLVSQGGNWLELLSSTVFSVPLTVHNTGTVRSDFVTLLFSNTTAGPAPAPIKTLVAYERAHEIPAGGSASVELAVKLEALTRVDDTGSRVLFPGDYTFFVDIDRMVSFQVSLTGTQTTVENFPQPS